MTAIGAMVTTTQEGQSVSSIFFILHLAPFYISWTFINDPHGPLAVALSLMPFTALMTIGMRNLVHHRAHLANPRQHVCANHLCLLAFWLAGRALRLGLLRYGQRLHWRSLFGSKKSPEGAK